MTLEKVQELLGVQNLKGNASQLNELVKMTEALVARQGEEWVKVHKQLLLAQWDKILELGI